MRVRERSSPHAFALQRPRADAAIKVLLESVLVRRGCDTDLFAAIAPGHGSSGL